MVVRAGLEPARGCPHWILNPDCLPIPTPNRYLCLTILDYNVYICQFKKTTKFIFLLLVIFIVGCATKKIVLPTSQVKPTWFSGEGNFNYLTYEGRVVPHLFFDFAPRIDMRTKLVDVFITTPRDSEVHFELDLVSGRIFKERKFCKEKDIWNDYTSNISTPNFSWAVIPRLLGRDGKPQRVAVFGDLKYLVDGSFPREETIQVQIIGGYILKSCLTGLCDLNDDWNSEVILIAKSMLDESLQEVQGLNTLKKYVDWKYAKAFIENSMGRNDVGRKLKGAYRLESPILPNRALKYVINSGHLFSNSELQTLKTSCRKVYDDALVIFRKEEGISQRFIEFYRNHLDRFSLCRKYVRPFNIQKEKDKHWKLEYLTAFENAVQTGYYFDCRLKTWVRNVRDSKGKFVVDQRKLIGGCRDHEIAASFPAAITLLSSAANSGAPYYRYIEYDSGADTFNQKIYNWVWSNGKKQSCAPDKEVGPIFPYDVRFNLK